MTCQLKRAVVALFVLLGYVSAIIPMALAASPPRSNVGEGKMVNIVNIYTMNNAPGGGAITFNFPTIPVIGNTLIYSISAQGENANQAFGPYNTGLGPHDNDFGFLVLGGNTLSSALTGGNGASVFIVWTQIVQATFNSITLGPFVDNGGVGVAVPTYITIYEVSGLIGQTPGNPVTTNGNPALDWREANVTTADASLVATGVHMFLEPSTNDCSCPPPGNCGANDHQVKFTIGANFGTIIAQAAIPGYDLFHITDPCDPAYVSDDFIFAINSNGAANALTVTDNIQGNWIIDYQIDGQIFAHIGSVSPTTPTGAGALFKLSDTQLSDQQVSGTTLTASAINSTYTTYGFVNAAKSTQNPLLGFHRKRFSETQMYIKGSGQLTLKAFPNYILKQDGLTFNPYVYTAPPVVLQTDPIDDIVRPLNISGNRVFVMYSTNAVGAAFSLSKTILCGNIDSFSTVNPNA